MFKTISIVLIGLSLQQGFAANRPSPTALTLNVSAQGQSSCKLAVLMFADLTLGKTAYRQILTAKIEHGDCDGVTCGASSQKFKINFNEQGRDYSWTIETIGPFRAGSDERCELRRL